MDSRQPFDRVVFWGVCALLIFFPLASGGEAPWASRAFVVSVLALGALHFGIAPRARRARHRAEPADRVETRIARVRPVPRPVTIGFAVFAAVTLFQFLPLPPLALEAVSPRTADAWRALGKAGWRPLSVSPSAALAAVAVAAGVIIFGALIYRAAGTTSRAGTVVFFMLATGVFQSLYGIANYLSSLSRISELGGGAGAKGTYLNRNHYSGLLEMLFALALGGLLANVGADRERLRRKGRSLREGLVSFGRDKTQKAVAFGLVAVILGLGIVFSRSRSGLAILGGITLATASLFAARGPGVRGAKAVLASVAAVLIVAAGVGFGPIVARFKGQKPLDDLRFVWYGAELRYIAAFPAAGTGLGTFASLFPRFGPAPERGNPDHAHNDYLEVLAESGLLGGGALILASLAWLAHLYRRWSQRRDSRARGLGLGTLMGLTALFAHGLLDSNFRVPANLAYFAAMWALAAQFVNKSERSSSLGDVGARPARGPNNPETLRPPVPSRIESEILDEVQTDEFALRVPAEKR